MHDIRAIRDNPAAFDAALSRRGLPAMSSHLLAIDEARRAKIHGAESAQAASNAASRAAGVAKGTGDDAQFERLRAEVTEQKAEIARLTTGAAEEDTRLHDILMGLPNLPLDAVPFGRDEAEIGRAHV